MNELVRYAVKDGVALITVDNPPVNALSRAVRAGLWAAVEAAATDRAAGAVVISARGKAFSAGADVRDLGRAAERPELGALLSRIEACPKPVIAAIQGPALGSGFELALACHFRLALRGAQLGLPDVALGVVPGAGGTQRLVRLAGARASLDMLIGGRPVTAQLAASLGLVDKVIEKNLGRAAFGTARNMAAAGTAPRPTAARRDGLRDPARFLEAVTARRRAHADDPRIAVHKAIDLVEAALLLPVEAGLQMERVAFEDLVDSSQARGLRHAFLAERRTGRVPAVRGAVARPVARLGLVGSGPQAEAIARMALGHGLAVDLLAEDAAAAEASRAAVETALAVAEAAGHLQAEAGAAQRANLVLATGPDGLAAADLVLADLPGAARREPATALFARLGPALRPGAVLASASPQSDLAALALASGRAGDVMRLVLFAPVESTRLVEVAPGPGAAADLAATGFSFARRLGRVPLWTQPGAGGIATRVFAAGLDAAALAVATGAQPAAVDAAMRGYGFELGPFAAAERAGPGFAALPLLPGATQPRELDAARLQARLVLAMAVEGARLVAGGVAQKPSDVDAAMLLGFGFPRWHGGPMQAADEIGLLAARGRMRRWAGESDHAAKLWTVPPIWDELIKTGRGFASLNG